MKIADIIKYEGDNDTFVWKYPIEDFNTTSQLIVHEAQEAIFFRDGQALDLFGPGRYTLETQNLPFLRRIMNIPTDGKTPFHCEVYFINKTMPLNIKWGTTSQIHVLDPKFNILLHAGASGGMGIQVEDSRKFLVKLVGTTNSFDKNTLTAYFRELIITRVKTYLHSIMSQVSFITVNSHLDDMSKAMHQNIANDIVDFGVKLINFFVSTIHISENDYQQIQKALADATVVGITATAEKGKMETLGYNWVDKEMAEILKVYAGNEGSQSNIGGMMAQMPIAFAFGQMLKDNTFPSGTIAFSNPSSAFGKGNSLDETGSYCPSCGRRIEENTCYCAGCGKPIASENVCTKCGREVKNDENFYPKCGNNK